jgi:hypothetical protein
LRGLVVVTRHVYLVGVGLGSHPATEREGFVAIPTMQCVSTMDEKVTVRDGEFLVFAVSIGYDDQSSHERTIAADVQLGAQQPYHKSQRNVLALA